MKTIIASAFLVALSIVAVSAQNTAPKPTSVPEPATLMLVAVGAVGAGYAAFRKRQK